ncbi:hypothetical protein D9M68_962530 [compost metagenome]
MDAVSPPFRAQRLHELSRALAQPVDRLLPVAAAEQVAERRLQHVLQRVGESVLGHAVLPLQELRSGVLADAGLTDQANQQLAGRVARFHSLHLPLLEGVHSWASSAARRSGFSASMFFSAQDT